MRNTLSLPSLSTTVRDLLALLRYPMCSAEDVAGVVEGDPALSARLLRLANAPASGLTQPVASVQHAVVLLGMNIVRGVALRSEIVECGHDLEKLWSHDCSVAGLARMLASHHKNRALCDEVFTAALLHDIGSAVMLAQYGDDMRRIDEIARSQQISRLDLERKWFSFDHSEVGGWLLTEWNLPAAVCAAVADHHSPRGRHAALVHLADGMEYRLTRCRADVRPQTRDLPPLDPQAVALAGLTLDEVKRCMDGAPTVMRALPAWT